MKIIGHKRHTIVITRLKNYIRVEVSGPLVRKNYKSTLTLTDAMDYLASVEMAEIDRALNTKAEENQ